MRDQRAIQLVDSQTVEDHMATQPFWDVTPTRIAQDRAIQLIRNHDSLLGSQWYFVGKRGGSEDHSLWIAFLEERGAREFQILWEAVNSG